MKSVKAFWERRKLWGQTPLPPQNFNGRTGSGLVSRLLLLLLAMALCTALASPAWARVYIDVTKPFSRRLPLALPAFQPMPASLADPVGGDGARLLKTNLVFTGLFDILDPKSYLGPPSPGKIQYRKWTKVGAELLIACSYTAAGDTLTLECRLYDCTEGKLLTGRRYDGVRADLPAMMQRFADEVMLAITGERSVFSTQIAFVGARQGKKGAIKEIYLMNWDGTGVRKLTHFNDLALYPAWSPDGSLVAYSAFVRRRPAIFVHALAGGSGKLVINKPGVNLTPAFTASGRALGVAMSHTGKTNIFKVDLAGNILSQLTNGWGIEVAPSFSPDGKKMAFVSDRGGSPQIYVLDIGSGSLRRLTFGFKYCAAPAWSPRGDRIAFQGQDKGGFQICTMKTDGSDMQVLTGGWAGGEDPTWSPDGRLIAYSSRKSGTYQIYVMTAGGRPIRRLTNLSGDNTDPSWSPRGVGRRD